MDMSCIRIFFFFFSSRRRHTRFDCDWSSDVCSSDLQGNPQTASNDLDADSAACAALSASVTSIRRCRHLNGCPSELSRFLKKLTRSEEHTSELQSQSNLVCRLLLEKKKKIINLLLIT